MPAVADFTFDANDGKNTLGATYVCLGRRAKPRQEKKFQELELRLQIITHKHWHDTSSVPVSEAPKLFTPNSCSSSLCASLFLPLSGHLTLLLVTEDENRHLLLCAGRDSTPFLLKKEKKTHEQLITAR